MLTPRFFALRTCFAIRALIALVVVLPVALPALAQTSGDSAVASLRPVSQSNRIAAGASLTPQLQLTGHIPAWVTPAHQTATAVDLSTPLHISVVLRRDPAVEAALDQLLADQQNPASSLYHQWITPEQLGTFYGPTQSDLDAITSWATSQGLTVASIQPNRVIVELNGSLATVSNALHTSFAYFTFGTETRLSATTDPAIPAAFGAVIQSIHGLTETHLQPQSRFSIHSLPVDNASPKITFTSGSHYLMANDFSAIYDLSSVYSGGNTGATIGSAVQRIAIVGESRVASADISNYESLAGLTSFQPNVVIPTNGTDPGTSNSDAAAEATLDVDRVIGTARGAAVDLVVSGTSQGEDGLDIAITYNVNTLRDPIMTISFGGCEAQNGQSTASFYNTEFQTAASGGMSVFVSSGDSGAAGCDTSFTNAPSSQTLSVNVLCSSSYVTCVGGTEFNDAASPSTYWNTGNGTGYESAMGYIPEGAWNEPNNYMTGNGYWIAATGGGTSVYIPRPRWQSGLAFPAGSYRLTPDVAFSAADHDGYFGCFAASNATCIVSGGQIPFTVFSGTSAAAPSMAGIAALINTQLGSKQGNMNPLLYGIDVSSPTAFHDATVATSGVTGCTTATPSMCNNSTPGPSTLNGGLAGYALLTGYDEATGLGSLDVAKFLSAVTSTTVATSLLVTANPSPAIVNQTVTLTATLTPGTSSKTPTGTVQFYANSVAIGSPVTIANNVATLSYAFTSAATDSIYAIYSGDTNFNPSTAPTISLVVNTAGFTITAATTIYSLVSGATTNPDAITITSVNNFAATLQLSCSVATASGTAAGSCTIVPNAATLTAGSTATSTLTITTTTGTSGILNVKVTGVSGSTTVTSGAITVNLTASAFTLTPSPAALPVTGTLLSGNTVTSTVTVASTNGFVGNVALTCQAATLSSSGTAAGTCSVSPASVTLSSGGTATTVVTIATTAGTSGVLTGTVTGTGTTANSSIATTAFTIVTVTTVTPTFTLTPASGTLTFTSGATTGNAYTITANSLNTFAGSVAVSCAITAGTAVDTADQPTCTATPASITLASGGTATSVISIGSMTAHAIPVTQRAQLERRYTLGTGGFFAMLLFIPALRRRRTLRSLATLALIACALSAISGCSSSTVSAPPVLKSSAGSYTVTVQGTGTPSGSSTAITATTTFSLTID
jgi:pseudomonalisin